MVSVMLGIRLAAGGAPRRAIVLLLIEVWVSYALVAAAIVAVATLLGPAESGSAGSELLSIATRWHRLTHAQQAWAMVGLVLAIAFFVQILLTIRKINRNYPLQ